MGKRAKILVVGGGNLERAPDGSVVAKVPLVDYVHELSDRLGHCVWLVQGSGTWGIELSESTARVEGRIDPDKVTAIEIDGRARDTFRNWALFLRYAIQRPYGVFFLPAFMTMVPILPIARLFLKKHAVYLAGDYEMTLEEQIRVRGRAYGVLFRAAYEGAMWLADFVIARGRHLARLAERHNRIVVETVPLGHMSGAERNSTAEVTPNQLRRLLFVGLVQRSKGVDDLLHALRAIGRRRPQPTIELDLLGEGPERPELEALCCELGLADRVRFHGWVENPETINRFFSGAHALVMPSSTHAEGVPRAIDEALVRGIPVVATRIAGVPAEFSDDEVLLVDTSSPDQLADALEAILFDPEVRARYKEGADRRRQRWSHLGSAARQHANLLTDTNDEA